MDKFTKGDWKAEGWLIVKDVKTPRLRYAIAETNCCDGISDEESTANARLIASAPTLKQQLEDYKEGCEGLKLSVQDFRQQRDDLLEACKITKKRLLTLGEWDDGCFYYAGTAAPELEESLKLLKAAIAKCEA